MSSSPPLSYERKKMSLLSLYHSAPVLRWWECEGNVWCSLNHVDISHPAFQVGGVYVIFSDGLHRQVVRIGQGWIADRVSTHRNDAKVQQYANLHVTWAEVQPSQRDGVERYLADTLRPAVGEAFPNTNPIPVNLPW